MLTRTRQNRVGPLSSDSGDSGDPFRSPDHGDQQITRSSPSSLSSTALSAKSPWPAPEYRLLPTFLLPDSLIPGRQKDQTPRNLTLIATHTSPLIVQAYV